MRENIRGLVDAEPGPGILHKLAGVIAKHDANITSVDIIEEHLTYFEIDVMDGAATVEDLAKLPIVGRATQVKTFQTVFGKRIIIMGGGAQVGQVAAGAISEAARHSVVAGFSLRFHIGCSGGF
jgi:energy-converting hydrogenase B subunit Q